MNETETSNTSSREFFPHYIGLNQDDESKMLAELGIENTAEIFKHLPKSVKHDGLKIEQGLDRKVLEDRLKELANKNNVKTNFLGDGLSQAEIPTVVSKICNIRGLTTAYTPYQPERSQGTLQTLWIYQNLISG